ncbi:MAG: ATP-binding protein [bacterium]
MTTLNPRPAPYQTRFIEQRLAELWAHFPIVAVLGARQVGKSTLVRHVLERKIKTIVFDPVQDVGGARQDPDLFLQNHPPPLFLDEIQYAPELPAALKRRVDASPAVGQYMISGSQNLMVLRGISESLAGRVAILNLPPMGYAELQRHTAAADTLSRWVRGQDPVTTASTPPPPPWLPAVWRGGYPGLLALPNHLVQTYLDSYVRTYIERDIRIVAAVGDLQLFGRFFGLLAAHTACEVNPTELGRELGIDHKTARHWLSIAEATYQWVEIAAFTRNPAKRVSGKNKGFMTDTGLACFHQRIPEPEMLPNHPLYGRLLETWVVTEILKRIQVWPTTPVVWHYHAHGGAEVDLILEWGGRLFPIEIKAKTHPARADARGITAFRTAHPALDIAPGLIISAVTEPERLAPDLFAIPWWTV